MIVEEPASPGRLDDHGIITSTSLNRSPERDVMEPKNQSYVSASPEGSQYSRTARSMLEESDNEDEGDDLGDISRNPSLVDESFIQDDDGRDGEEFPGAIEEQPRNVVSCEPFPMCQGDLPGLPVCQGSSLAEQIDMMTQCHPLDLFSVFHENDGVGGDPSEHLIPGMHFIPRECEYCGAIDTDLCTGKCQRPKSFFHKKRPPLCPKDDTVWEPVTDLAIDLKEREPCEPATMERKSSLTLKDFFR